MGLVCGMEFLQKHIARLLSVERDKLNIHVHVQHANPSWPDDKATLVVKQWLICVEHSQQLHHEGPEVLVEWGHLAGRSSNTDNNPTTGHRGTAHRFDGGSLTKSRCRSLWWAELVASWDHSHWMVRSPSGLLSLFLSCGVVRFKSSFGGRENGDYLKGHPHHLNKTNSQYGEQVKKW